MQVLFHKSYSACIHAFSSKQLGKGRLHPLPPTLHPPPINLPLRPGTEALVKTRQHFHNYCPYHYSLLRPAFEVK
jgi:hypothetical protein